MDTFSLNSSFALKYEYDRAFRTTTGIPGVETTHYTHLNEKEQAAFKRQEDSRLFLLNNPDSHYDLEK